MRLIPEGLLERAAARWRSERFADARDGLRRRAGALLAVELEPPDEPAGLYHNYFCPDHAAELRFDPSTPHAHVCPVDGHVWSGSPFDEAWRFGANHLLAHGALQAALLWRLDGDARAADRAAAVLTGYARRYPGYPLGTHTSRGGARGKATYQSLDEANIVVPMARAYDLLRERLPPRDRDLIEGDLLKPAARHIRAQRFHEVHNIECWHHAALAAVGTAIGDDALVDEAIDGAFGFWRLLRDGLADGLWWECSSSYHFYAAHALTTLAAVGGGGPPGVRAGGGAPAHVCRAAGDQHAGRTAAGHQRLLVLLLAARRRLPRGAARARPVRGGGRLVRRSPHSMRCWRRTTAASRATRRRRSCTARKRFRRPAPAPVTPARTEPAASAFRTSA